MSSLTRSSRQFTRRYGCWATVTVAITGSSVTVDGFLSRGTRRRIRSARCDGGAGLAQMLSDADVTINSIASGRLMLWLAAWLRGAGRLVFGSAG